MKNFPLSKLCAPQPTLSQRGFTLIEVVMAIAIFGVLSIMAYSGLHSVIQGKVRTEVALDRLQQLQLSLFKLTDDMQQLSNRDAMDALGGNLLKLTTQDSDYLLSFTRGGWRNPANRPRSSLQRVAYRLDEDKLIRRYWYYVDRADDEHYVDQEIINNIEALEFRFMDEKGQWQDDWPSASALASSSTTDLPRAVEITLKMYDWGDIQRLVKVAQ